MRLSVSALAWNPDEHPAALKILAAEGVGRIELVPSRILDAGAELEELRRFSISPVAFQALLFGTSGLHLFQSPEQRERLLRHLLKLADLARDLGVQVMVFGSPSNRWVDPSILTAAEARRIAMDFFGELGRSLEGAGVYVCLEPNPPIYGCNFLTTTAETAEFVRELSSPMIKLNLDLGAVSINRENLDEILLEFGGEVAHLHLSEPGLAPIFSTVDQAQHSSYAARLAGFVPKFGPQTVSIEMKRPSEGLLGLGSVIQKVRKIYDDL